MNQSPYAPSTFTAEPATRPLTRRSMLAATAAVAVTGLTGCLDDGGDAAADAADPDDGINTTDNTDDDADGDTGSCDDIAGEARTYDPDHRTLPFLFDYPDTFTEYNENINSTPDSFGAQFGHLGAGHGSYPVNIAVFQHRQPSEDMGPLTDWNTQFDLAEPVDWSFEYDGEAIEIYDGAHDVEDSSQWRFLLPAADAPGYHGIFLQFQDVRADFSCLDVLTGVVQELCESLTPNPAYQVEA